MDRETFVERVFEFVAEQAVQGLGRTLNHPPGRKPHQRLVEISTWFKQCSNNDKEIIKKIIEEAVDTALFDFFCVIDGSATIEHGTDKGEFYIVYKGSDGREIIISGGDGDDLHDLYNSISKKVRFSNTPR